MAGIPKAGCGYRGFEFGGGYLDAVCIDGWLWDEDSVEDGMLYHGGPDFGYPCPKCRAAIYRRCFGCSEDDRKRRVKRAFGKTPWIPSNGPKKVKK